LQLQPPQRNQRLVDNFIAQSEKFVDKSIKILVLYRLTFSSTCKKSASWDKREDAGVSSAWVVNHSNTLCCLSRHVVPSNGRRHSVLCWIPVPSSNKVYGLVYIGNRSRDLTYLVGRGNQGERVPRKKK
jgi:hypothetical protein